MKHSLPKELTDLVFSAGKVLGTCIKNIHGEDFFNLIEIMRKKMKSIRDMSHDEQFEMLSATIPKLRELNSIEIHNMVHSFSTYFELMNSCEQAYRTFKNRDICLSAIQHEKYSLTYVFTAHPTEARSEEILKIFHIVVKLLTKSFSEDFETIEKELAHYLTLALLIPMSKNKKPTVKDEADHIYSILLKDSVLDTLISVNSTRIPLYLRTWVGGDKDGHPFIDEKVMLMSLGQSRKRLVQSVLKKLSIIDKQLILIKKADISKVRKTLRNMTVLFMEIKSVKENDGIKLQRLKNDIDDFHSLLKDMIFTVPEELVFIQNMLQLFPGLVIPLELREDSGVVRDALKQSMKTAIQKMLETISLISNGGDIKWYVRGLVISNTESAEDLMAALRLVEASDLPPSFPVIPLFETRAALENAQTILNDFFSTQDNLKRVKSNWESLFEVMVGYSDSAKENGVLYSRVLIARALKIIENTLSTYDIQPIFFHGSGGSVARGGGSIQEQIEWWPQSALERFKVTIQGEMVQRTFSSKEILLSMISKINNQLEASNTDQEIPKELIVFSQLVSKNYQELVGDQDFLYMVKKITPYPYLDQLKIGSRPSKRKSGTFSLKSLRAIPWVLCWTQMRALFPVWWGVGSAWESLELHEKESLKNVFKDNALFRSYIKSLSFTLSKVEPAVFKLYLTELMHDKEKEDEYFERSLKEFESTKNFVKQITQENNLLWFRPWLAESIRLRSSTINLLNIIQIIAMQENDSQLLRETVTGISCGMMTTG